jgi:hypothetical protein
MGVMRFLVHPEELLEAWPEIHGAYVSGHEGRVYHTQVSLEGNVLVCRRQSSESGKLQVQWPLAGLGKPVISTSTLPEREQPYVLAVELARGKIAQLRDQAAAWELAGMSIPVEYRKSHQAAYALFTESIGLQDTPAGASNVAARAIEQACRAAEVLARSYCLQRLEVRRQQSPQLPASLGCHLESLDAQAGEAVGFAEQFSAAAVPISWDRIEPVEGTYHWDLVDSQVEWCEERRIWVLGGPLLDLSAGGLPAWLEQWSQDFPNLLSFVCDFVETAMSRYAGRIRSWEVCAGTNAGGAFGLDDEHRIMLAARALEVASRVDAESTLLVRVDQPWGENQARGHFRLSPLQYVDALMRSGVGLAGVNLEIVVGYEPRGSAFRDLLDVSRLLDLWSCLGAPLYVTLACPSAAGADPGTFSGIAVGAPQCGEEWSEGLQAKWIDRYLPVLMAKQSVVGVFWAHYSDARRHTFPHAGLLGLDGSVKSSFRRFQDFRASYQRGREGLSQM